MKEDSSVPHIPKSAVPRSQFRNGALAVRCPLCKDWMEQRYITPSPQAPAGTPGSFVFVCHRDRVHIAATDPIVNRWEELRAGKEPVPCPHCNAEMRLFFNSAGRMKGKCPKKKCGATIEGFNLKDDKVKAIDPSRSVQHGIL